MSASERRRQLKQGDREAAIASFEKASAASRGHFPSRFNLGVLLLAEGKEEAGIETLEQAVALRPNDERANVSLGMAYLHAGRGPDAHRSLLLVRRLHPRNSTAALGLAVLYASSERPDRAQALLSEALELGGQPAQGEASRHPVLAELLDPPTPLP